MVNLFLQGTHPHGGAHAKFTNYKFDVDEFVKIVKNAEKHVKNHDGFKEFIANIHNGTQAVNNRSSINEELWLFIPEGIVT